MAEESTKLEKIPLMERAAEAFERCVQIRDKVLPRLSSIYTKKSSRYDILIPPYKANYQTSKRRLSLAMEAGYCVKRSSRILHLS